MRYDLTLPRRVVFGWGRREELGTLAATLGRRAFLVTGSRTLEQRGVGIQHMRCGHGVEDEIKTTDMRLHLRSIA